MGHAVDKDLLHLVQDEVRDLIKDYQTMESQVNLQNKQIDKVEEDVSTLKDQFSSQEAGFLSTMEKKLQEVVTNRSEEIGQVLKRLLSFEAQLSMRLELVAVGLAKTVDNLEQLEQSQIKTDDRVEQVEQIQTKTTDRVEQLEQSQARAGDRREELEQRCDQVEQIEAEVKCLKTNNSHLGKLSLRSNYWPSVFKSFFFSYKVVIASGLVC